MFMTKAGAAFRGVVLVAVILGIGATPAMAQTTLRYKFKKGEKLNYEVQENTDSTANLLGNDLTMNMRRYIAMTWHVLDVNPEGKVRIVHRIDGIRMTMDAPPPFGKMDYDSKNGRIPEGPIGKDLGPIFNALASSEFIVTMDSRGDVSDVEVPAKLIEVLKKIRKDALGLNQTFSPDNLKVMVREGILLLPKQPVAQGTNWTQKIDAKMPFGSGSVTNTMTYAGPAGKDLQKITINPVVALDPATKGSVSIKLKSGTGEGMALFDNAAGRVVELNLTQNMQMEINAEGQVISQNVRITRLSKLKR